MSKDKKPIAWGCRTCNKIDWADKEEQTAKPEHVCYRGTDIGECDGEMIPLYGETINENRTQAKT